MIIDSKPVYWYTAINKKTTKHFSGGKRMNTTFELGNLKVIDLTKPLDPKTESRRCHLIRYNTGGPIPDFHTAMDLTVSLSS